MNYRYTTKQIKKESRKIVSLYNKYFFDPVARKIVFILANFTEMPPFFVTIIRIIISLVSAFLFLKNRFIEGAVLFQIAEILDGVDGLLARVKKSGNIYGIVFDSYSDVLNLSLNILALSWVIINNDLTTGILLFVFLALNFSESFIDIAYLKVERYLKKYKKTIKLNYMEKQILKLKDYLEKRGLKVNLLYYQERIFCVMFLGPITGDIFLFTIVGIVLVIFSVHLKLLLDIAIIKSSILNNKEASIRVHSI